MSLTLFSTVFDVGFHPRDAAPPAQHPIPTAPSAAPKVQSSNQETVDTGGAGQDSGSSFEQRREALGLATSNTRYAIDLDSQDVVIKVIDPESQQEVRQIPTEDHVELSKRIQKYQERVFKQ